MAVRRCGWMWGSLLEVADWLRGRRGCAMAWVGRADVGLVRGGSGASAVLVRRQRGGIMDDRRCLGAGHRCCSPELRARGMTRDPHITWGVERQRPRSSSRTVPDCAGLRPHRPDPSRCRPRRRTHRMAGRGHTGSGGGPSQIDRAGPVVSQGWALSYPAEDPAERSPASGSSPRDALCRTSPARS